MKLIDLLKTLSVFGVNIFSPIRVLSSPLLGQVSSSKKTPASGHSFYFMRLNHPLIGAIKCLKCNSHLSKMGMKGTSVP